MSKRKCLWRVTFRDNAIAYVKAGNHRYAMVKAKQIKPSGIKIRDVAHSEQCSNRHDYD